MTNVSVVAADADARRPTFGAKWVWLSLIPMGLGSWVPIYAGAAARKRRWWLIGMLWSIVTVAGWILATAASGGLSDAGGLLIILGWAGGFASSAVIRAISRRSTSPFDAGVADARERLAQREQARQLAHTDPSLAREMGIGRPDIPGAQDAGLVDVNNVPPSVLASLPGVDGALASRIEDARTAARGFSSVEDLGAALDLDGGVVEGLRENVVFLPQS